jgi:hypothetical protein
MNLFQKKRGFVAKNQNFIIGIRAVALITIGYLAYQKFIAEPKQFEANK